MDKRLQNLSYSSLLTLHSCPRKFQLYRLNAQVEQVEDIPGSITFAYGHAVGTGIQNILTGLSVQETMLRAFLEWDVDLLAENEKQNKSFWGAMLALQQFASLFQSGYLRGYKLVMFNGKPATELSFLIDLPNGFKFRGFVDAVLQHEVTGKVLVLEVKTTNAATVNPAQYKNSAQAIGYSVVLDAIFPELSSYQVLYLVYQTKSEEFVQLPFEKSYYARALWLRELMLDIDVISMYEENQLYPMRGESCFTFFRECEYLQVCTLSTERLTTKLTPEEEEKLDKQLEEFQIKVTLQDLIEAQLAKDPAPPALINPTDDDEFI